VEAPARTAVPSVRVCVPASSANLGPGFDCFAAALGIHLELEVAPAARFELVTDLDVRRDRANLAVAAFERLHSAERLRFELRSQIPLSGGLGSSAAAVVAGLLAAAHLAGGPSPARHELLALATGIEGHPDNAAAALYGGVVICAEPPPEPPHRLEAPAALAALLVVPYRAVRTQRARAVLDQRVPLADAVYNTAHAALLALALQTGDLELLARGLRDRLHQPHRAHLYPRSAELLQDAASLGALGATISGAGPSVLVWVQRDRAEELATELRRRAKGWAAVLAAPFTVQGAQIIGAP
jgi:homoserine kinase